jgi:hypothetical protein
MAASLAAQQLSFGPLALGAGSTKTLNVVLASQGATIWGLQFDVDYNTTWLTVSIALGGSATAAVKELSLTNLPAAYNPSTISPVDAGPGQRAIVIGAGLTDSTVPATAINNPIGDGVVAILTITVAPGAPSGSQSLTLSNLYATGPAASVSLTPINGTVNMYTTYLVGDVAPPTSDTAPNFGNGVLDIQDLILEFFAVNHVPGYVPAACSDRFDAMDVSPADTATTRGGDGKLDIQDLILEFFRVNKVDLARPVRTSLGGVCALSESGKSSIRTSRNTARPPVEVQGTLVLGTAEGSGTSQDRVPVYLRAGRDLVRVAVTFGLGDQQSRLRFEAVPGLAPSLVEDGQSGVVAAAWLEGLNVSAGQRLLLGYIVGPSGSAANLKVFGASASGRNDNQEVGLDVSGAPVVH